MGRWGMGTGSKPLAGCVAEGWTTSLTVPYKPSPAIASVSSIVSFQHVSFRIGSVDILRDLHFEIHPGETVVLLGRSGSGKTSVLKLVNGLHAPSHGTILVDGIPTTEWDLITLRRRIGYVIQEGGLFPHLTVAENVGLVPRLERWGKDRILERVTTLLEEVGLPRETFGGRFPRELSGGQRQRVGVARALAADPPLLLFDEPFGAVDPITRTELQKQFLLLRHHFRKTALFVTHDVREALTLGTRIGLLNDGRLEVLATPSEFRRTTGQEIDAFLSCLNEPESS